jgi:tetratricopeptide (TPR) repeat protein
MSKEKLQFLSPLFLKYQSDFEKNPRSRVFAPLAEAYRKVGMTDKAMEVLSQGIRFNPNYVMGFLGLAFCYFDLSQFNLAYSTLRPLVNNNRDNLRLQRLFADTCIQLGKKDEALDTLKYLLFINPRDKEVASLVLNVEREVEEGYRHEHKPIIIPEENLTDHSENRNVQLFNVEKLNSNPKIDFDDWLPIDLGPKESSSNQNNSILDNWNMKNISEENIDHKKNEDELTLKPDITLDYQDNKEAQEILKIVESESIPVEKVEVSTPKKTRSGDVPFVTHTLVDLYCGQGHIEKALEILEKILILNPNDQKTIDKIAELKHLIAPYEEPVEKTTPIIKPVPQNNIVHTQFTNLLAKTSAELLNLDQVSNVTEEEGRRQLMSLLDEKVFINVDEPIVKLEEPKSKKADKNTKHDDEVQRIQIIEERLGLFLKKIQQRALDYQNRF